MYSVLCRLDRGFGGRLPRLSLSLVVGVRVPPVHALDEIVLEKVERVGDQVGQALRIEAGQSSVGGVGLLLAAVLAASLLARRTRLGATAHEEVV